MHPRSTGHASGRPTDYAIVTCDRYSAPRRGRLDCCSPATVTGLVRLMSRIQHIVHVYGDTEHYHSWATYWNLFCYSFVCAVLGNRLNVKSHHNHHQHQRMTKVKSWQRAHKELTAVCNGQLKIRIRILPVKIRKKNPQWPSAFYTLFNPQIRMSAFYRKPMWLVCPEANSSAFWLRFWNYDLSFADMVRHGPM